MTKKDWKRYLVGTFFELYKLNNGPKKAYIDQVLALLTQGTESDWNKFIANSNTYPLYITAQIIVGLTWLHTFRPTSLDGESTALLDSLSIYKADKNVWMPKDPGSWVLGLENPHKPQDLVSTTLPSLLVKTISGNILTWFRNIGTSLQSQSPYAEIVTGTVVFHVNGIDYSPSITLHVNTKAYVDYIIPVLDKQATLSDAQLEQQLKANLKPIPGIIPAENLSNRVQNILDAFKKTKTLLPITSVQLKEPAKSETTMRTAYTPIAKLKEKVKKIELYLSEPDTPFGNWLTQLRCMGVITPLNYHNLVPLDNISPIVLPIAQTTEKANQTKAMQLPPLTINMPTYLPTKVPKPEAFISKKQLPIITEVLKDDKLNKKFFEDAIKKEKKPAPEKKPEKKPVTKTETKTVTIDTLSPKTPASPDIPAQLASLVSVQTYEIKPQEPKLEADTLSILQLTFIDKPALASETYIAPRRTIMIPIAVDELSFTIPSRNIKIKSIGDLRVIPKSNSWITYQLTGKIPYGISEINKTKDKKNIGLYLARVLWALAAQPDLYVISHLYIATAGQYKDYCPNDILGKYVPTGLQSIQTQFTIQDTYYLHISILGGIYV